MRFQRKKWYWVGFGCFIGITYGPYRSEKAANRNKPASKQFKLSKRYPGES